MTRALIAVALLGICTPALAEWSTGTPAKAQEQSAGPLIDGIVNRVEQRVQKVEHNTGRIADWLERSEKPDGPISKFLDRIGNGMLLICGTIVLVGLPIGIALLIREGRLTYLGSKT